MIYSLKKFSSLMGIPDNDDFSIFVLVNNKGYYDIFMTFEAFTPIGDVLKEDKLIKQLGVSNEESYVLENISREDATEFIKALYLYDRRPDFNSSRETNAPIPVKDRHNFLIKNDAFSISDLVKGTSFNRIVLFDASVSPILLSQLDNVDTSLIRLFSDAYSEVSRNKYLGTKIKKL